MSYTIVQNGLDLIVTNVWSRIMDANPDTTNISNNLDISQAAKEFLIQKEFPTLSARNNVIHPDGVESGWARLESGNPQPPNPQKHALEIKVPHSNKNFRERFRKGEIILSDYTVAVGSVSVYPGNPVISSTNLGDFWFSVKNTFQKIDWLGLTQRGTKGRYFCTAPGYESYFLTASAGYLRRQLYRRVKDFTMLNEPIKIQDFYSIVNKQLLVDPELVTGVLADANKKSLDILTALAETPETIKGVLDGFSRIHTIVKDFRSKNFSITKAFKSEYDKSLLDFQRNRAGLLRELDRAKNIKAKRRVQKRLLYLEKDFGRRTERSIAEANSAVADIWLSFRYAIMPNVYLIDDVLEAQSAALSAYGTSRDRSTNSDVQLPDYAGWKLEKNINVTHRSMCKRRYAANSSLSRGLSSTLSWNIPVTIWELMPYSFVIDWFVNIGDYISALFGIDFYLEQGQSYSWKTNIDCTYTSTNGVKAIYYLDAYRRVVINPNDYIGLCVQPELNLKRSIDSLALSWAPIKRLLLSKKD